MAESAIQVEKIQLLGKPGALKAFATIKVGELLMIKNLRIIDGKKGLFVAMPSEAYTDKTSQEKKYNDIVVPLNKVVYQQVQKMVLAAYSHAVKSPAQ